jgi:hypothetical protein
MTEQTPAPDENEFPDHDDVPVEGRDPQDALQHDPETK